ncbi:MAG: class I SAM-dependent methyltransferase [Anaerolineae bacterium]
MTKYLHHYGVPTSLKGKTVLDIGTASGYFALECARRGGQVTAVDIYEDSILTHLASTLNVDIRYVTKSIYELDENFGRFDLVICGSLLLHLPDQLGAIRRIHSVCRDRAIIATACTPDSQTNPRPICEFLGLKASDGDYWTYWSVGAVALRNMLLASGFSRVGNEHHFTLRSEPGRTEFATPHVAMTGIV